MGRHLVAPPHPSELHRGHEPNPEASVNPGRYAGRVEGRVTAPYLGHDTLPKWTIGKLPPASTQVVAHHTATPRVTSLPDRETAGQLAHDVADQRASAPPGPRHEGDHRGADVGVRKRGLVGRQDGVGDGSALRRGFRAASIGDSASLIIDFSQARKVHFTCKLGGEALAGSVTHYLRALGIIG